MIDPRQAAIVLDGTLLRGSDSNYEYEANCFALDGNGYLREDVVDVINRRLANECRSVIDRFLVSGVDSEGTVSSLSMEPRLGVANASFVSVGYVWEEGVAGAASPDLGALATTLSTESGNDVGLDDLLVNGDAARTRLTDAVGAAVDNQYPLSRPVQMRDLTEFVLEPTAIRFLLQPCDVTSCVYQPLEAAIPYQSLDGVIRDEVLEQLSAS